MIGYQNLKVLQKRVSVDPTEKYSLSPEQIQFFEDNGYLVIKKLISIPDLNRYRERFVSFCNGQVDRRLVTVTKDYSLSKTSTNPEDFINKIQELHEDEVFSTYSENPRILQIASQLIGDDLTAIHCMLVNKPPGTNMHPPHQDFLHLPFRSPEQIVGFWTAIDPTNKENGCLFVVPGSHKPRELLEHDHLADDQKKFYFSVRNWKTIAPEHKWVYLNMDPGDTVILSSTLIHGSLPNISKSYRKAISSVYVNTNFEHEDTKGSKREVLATIVEAALKEKGSAISYVDMYRTKGKVVKGVRSNL